MKAVLLGLVGVCAVAGATQEGPGANMKDILRAEASAYQGVTCFFKSEQISGMNKICYYDCLGSTAAITISAVSLCPLTITR